MTFVAMLLGLTACTTEASTDTNNDTVRYLVDGHPVNSFSQPWAESLEWAGGEWTLQEVLRGTPGTVTPVDLGQLPPVLQGMEQATPAQRAIKFMADRVQTGQSVLMTPDYWSVVPSRLTNPDGSFVDSVAIPDEFHGALAYFETDKGSVTLTLVSLALRDPVYYGEELERLRTATNGSLSSFTSRGVEVRVDEHWSGTGATDLGFAVWRARTFGSCPFSSQDFMVSPQCLYAHEFLSSEYQNAPRILIEGPLSLIEVETPLNNSGHHIERLYGLPAGNLTDDTPALLPLKDILTFEAAGIRGDATITDRLLAQMILAGDDSVVSAEALMRSPVVVVS